MFQKIYYLHLLRHFDLNSAAIYSHVLNISYGFVYSPRQCVMSVVDSC